MITGQLHSCPIHSMNNLAPVTYIVLDHKSIKVKVESGKTVDAVIMSLDQNPKMVSSPGSDVLLCYAPQLGTISEIRAIIPSVLFWTDRFWTPFLETTPSRIDLARELQLNGIRCSDGKVSYPYINVDIIYEINVVDIPDLDWGLFNY